MNIVAKIRRHGLRRSAQIASYHAQNFYAKWKTRNVLEFAHPTPSELVVIEEDLAAEGVRVVDYAPDAAGFRAFQKANYFPADYHGGIGGPVWDEKLLEHWIAAERLGLPQYREGDVYVDVAAGSSPWAHALRSSFGIQAFAIDLSLEGSAYKDLAYYRVEDATRSSFGDTSVNGTSLQCSFEMFMGDDDTRFIRELARILKPGGKAVILPLYMHTHYCAYASARFYGHGHADEQAVEYLCRDYDSIPSARYYDVEQFMRRILKPVTELGMTYNLLALRNKSDFGSNIYCHFILEVVK